MLLTPERRAGPDTSLDTAAILAGITLIGSLIIFVILM
jgi:hypothetical protein